VGSAITGHASQGRLSGIATGTPNLLLYTRFDNGSTPPPPPPPPPPSVSISGPSNITYGGTYQWYAAATGGNGSYSYQWQLRYSYGGAWYNVGSNSSTLNHYVHDMDGPFSLRVTVTSGGVSATSAEFHVTKHPMCGDYYC
jgi:hypothetical protein